MCVVTSRSIETDEEEQVAPPVVRQVSHNSTNREHVEMR
jgi:hypothetical protein